MSLQELIMRLIIAFITLLVLTRIMGRKEISQMTFFNFISAISIGTIGASLAIDSTLSVRNGVTALISWSIFTILLGFLDIKSTKIRYAIVGQPIILIKEGQILEQSLRKSRLDIDSLNSLLRKKNVFAISDVDYAFFETDGSISVMKKENKQTVTKNDMNLPESNTIFPRTLPVISDGIVNFDHLKEFNLNDKWLNKHLKQAGINAITDVFYAEIQKDGSLHIDRKQS